MDFISEIQISKRWDTFEQWFYHHFFSQGTGDADPILSKFIWNFPFSMQSGVFIQFLQEQGIFIKQDFGYSLRTGAERTYTFKPYFTNVSAFATVIFNPDYATGLKECILRSFNL